MNHSAPLRVLYRITCPPAEAEARALGIALEQSVELPAEAIPPAVEEAGIPGQVESIRATGENEHEVCIRYRVENTGFEITQLLNVLFGNTSLQQSVSLLDADLPPGLLSVFPGPAFGIPGLRRLVGAPERPLTCTALKPMGSSPQDLAELCGRFARAGIDIIKDDHGLANQVYAPFAERVRLCMDAVEEAAQKTGRRSLYVPNLSGGPSRLCAQLEIARAAGVGAVMFSPMLVGVPVFAEIVQAAGGLPVIAHPALAGAQRISASLLLGRLYRLIGADASIFVNFGGRFGFSAEECRRLAGNLRQPWAGAEIKPAFPVPAGGMTLERVGEMVRFYGRDTILLISGGLYAPGDELDRRSRDFVAAVRNFAEISSTAPLRDEA